MSPNNSQQTIATPISFEGIGIHRGRHCHVSLHPYGVNKGLVFSRNGQMMPVGPDIIFGSKRATLLKNNDMSISTPEHLLSACVGMNIHNLLIECTEEELPILDGSALPFCDLIKKAGLIEQNAPINTLTLDAPLWIKEGDAQILLIPSTHPIYTYALCYPQIHVGSQVVSYDTHTNTYYDTISPARTYGFEHELNALYDQGLAKGGSLDCALVIGEDRYINPPRLPEEMARHKLLDMMGDFALLGCQLNAHVIGMQSGHSLNIKAVKQLARAFKRL